MIDATQIHQNYQMVQEKIIRACQSVQRSTDSVGLVVVTKAQPPEVIRAVVDAGAKIIGENYPDETERKMQILGPLPQVAWHMIGHVQSRKARIVACRFDLLESLDSIELARKMSALMIAEGRTLPVLLEMNVGGELSKGGWDASQEVKWPDLYPVVEEIIGLPGLSIGGLMTMPPFAEEAELSRPFFIRLVRLRDHLAGRYPSQDWTHLSMGTSTDYPVAIQAGATLVRVGTAIVGLRPPKGI